MKADARKRGKIGRPPRLDNPVRIDTRMAGELREWLKLQAGREGRPEGAIIEDALREYRRKLKGDE